MRDVIMGFQTNNGDPNKYVVPGRTLQTLNA